MTDFMDYTLTQPTQKHTIRKLKRLIDKKRHTLQCYWVALSLITIAYCVAIEFIPFVVYFLGLLFVFMISYFNDQGKSLPQELDGINLVKQTSADLVTKHVKRVRFRLKIIVLVLAILFGVLIFSYNSEFLSRFSFIIWAFLAAGAWHFGEVGGQDAALVDAYYLMHDEEDLSSDIEENIHLLTLMEGIAEEAISNKQHSKACEFLQLRAYYFHQKVSQTAWYYTTISGPEDLGSHPETDEEYLSLVKEKGHEAQVAIREKNFSEAAELFRKQKLCHNRLSTRLGESGAEWILFDSSVSEYLANLSRLSKNHIEALAHIIYWVANSKTKTKDQERKLRAYFNRAELGGTTADNVIEYCFADGVKVFNIIKVDIYSWK